MKAAQYLSPFALGFFLLNICFLSTNCVKENNLYLNGAPIKVVAASLTDTLKISSCSPQFSGVTEIHFVDDGKLMLSYADSDTLLRLYDISENRILNVAYSEMENDAYELVSISNVRHEGSKLLIDAFTIPYAITTFDYYNILSGIQPYCVKKTSFELFAPWSIAETRYAFSDNGSFVTEQYNEGRKIIRLSDSCGVFMRNIPLYDEHPYKNSDWNHLLLMYPDGGKFVLLMCFLDKINYLDIKSVSGFTVTTENKPMSDITVSRRYKRITPLEQPCYYYAGCVTYKYVYTLYASSNSLQKVVNGCHIPVLRVFSWDGALVAEYVLNSSLLDIAVDEDKHILYGLTYDNHIYSYLLTL